ncbi:MAG TPA: hypothetical protein VJI32_01260 [Candidatus Nanoarchaeia archaeon]|nr:hypothetical protein [Candidatus Nanoarchaeia archaeon]
MNSNHQKEHSTLEKIVSVLLVSAILARPQGGMWLGEKVYELKAYLSGKPAVVYDNTMGGRTAADFYKRYDRF